MFDRFFMYWLLWLLFMIVFFFMDQGKKRTLLSVWLLSVISLSSIDVTFNHVHISLSMMMIIFGAFIYMTESGFSFLQLFSAFTMMIVYCGLLIWQIIAPVWFFLSGYFMIPVLVVLIAILLVKQFQNMYACLLLGMSLGQCIFDWLISAYQLHDQIGSSAYFIHICLAILLVLMMHHGIVLFEYCSRLTRRFIKQ